MIRREIQDSVRILAAQGKSLRSISVMLALSRNAVRRILRGDGAREDVGAEGPPCDAATLERLRRSFAQAGGNVMRAQEMLAAEGLEVSYSTLTRWVREAGLRKSPKRAGSYDFAPGEEMQHDTSPHRVSIGGRTATAQCAALVLAFSRRLFVQYHPRFTRFEAKAFLLEAVRFMQGSCPVCVIDNSSVLLAAGAGADAIIAPEMAAFARSLGFGFVAHRPRHPDRKGRIERQFSYIERHFLAGRSFADYDDLNRQVLAWCREVANHKDKRVLGMSPNAAWLIEKPHLVPLPAVLPPVYDLLDRSVDLCGYVSVDTNRYSIPDRFVGRLVTVMKLPTTIRILCKSEEIALHPRLIGQRDGKSTLPGHHVPRPRQALGIPVEEKQLLGHHPSLDRYAAALRQRSSRNARRHLRRLLELKRTYPSKPLIAAIEQALHYGLFDLGRLEALILKQVAGDFFALDQGSGDDA
jgi:hypothetical protein